MKNWQTRLALVYKPRRPSLGLRVVRRIQRSETTESCWIWRAHILPSGYPQFSIINGWTVGAHRLIYELYVDDIPENKQIDHLCKNRSCVNPWHLEVVSPRENTLRSNAVSALCARKTHCIRGHKLPNPTYYPSAGSVRICSICRRQRDNERYRRKHDTQISR